MQNLQCLSLAARGICMRVKVMVSLYQEEWYCCLLHRRVCGSDNVGLKHMENRSIMSANGNRARAVLRL